jgi:hypothetical protein
MTRAVGLPALALAALALAGCGDQGGAAFHNTVAHGHNKIVVAEKRFQNAALAARDVKAGADLAKVKSLCDAYGAAVDEAEKDFASVPVPDHDAARAFQKGYEQYLRASKDAVPRYEKAMELLKQPREGDKGDVRKIFEAEAAQKAPLEASLTKLQKKFVKELSLSFK